MVRKCLAKHAIPSSNHEESSQKCNKNKEQCLTVERSFTHSNPSSSLCAMNFCKRALYWHTVNISKLFQKSIFGEKADQKISHIVRYKITAKAVFICKRRLDIWQLCS